MCIRDRIEQEEYCFDIAYDDEGASLLINSNEQMLSEKPVSYTHLDVYKRQIPLLPSITSDCCRLDDYVALHYLLKHMAHLVQAAVWTAGLDDRLTDSGLISFQLFKAYACFLYTSRCV